MLSAAGSPAGLSAPTAVVDLLRVGAGVAYLSAALWVRRHAARPLVAAAPAAAGVAGS